MKPALVLLAALTLVPGQEKRIAVGAKNFTENQLLAEIYARLLEAEGWTVDRKLTLQGTLVAFEALRNREIDVYVEYTGTLEQSILKLDRRVPVDDLRAEARARFGVELLRPIGFNNTYALAMRRDRAASLGLRAISDLAGRPELQVGLTHEFLDREDGWPGLVRAYGLPQTPTGMEHGLAYRAIDEGAIDVHDAYSTDAELRQYDLIVLRDDRRFFPEYLAAPLLHDRVPPDARRILDTLAGALDDAAMSALNARVVVDRETPEAVAAAFVAARRSIVADVAPESRAAALARRTVEHLGLTGAALLLALLIGLPVGVAISRAPRVAQPVLWIAGVLQTIPSIALLAALIPLLGIGAKPAIAALFLYGLLPIIRNTATGIFTIDPTLRRVAVGMGLRPWERLTQVELPLAAPAILAGIRTSAVISIGTATLAAFIGAGGLGEPIVTGLARARTDLILEGAVPAAALAVGVELAFELVERAVVPRHLRRHVGT